MATIQEPEAGIATRELLAALTALRRGDFSVRLPVEWTGVAGKVADAFNDVIELNERMANELERLSRVVGKEGKITQRAVAGRCARLLGSLGQFDQQLDQRSRSPDQRNRPRDRRRGEG